MMETSKAFSSFSVDDLEKARTFYSQVLNLKVIKHQMGMLELHIPGCNPVIVYPKPEHRPATFTVLNFAVQDIDAAVDALLTKGVKLERYEGFNMDEKGISRSTGSEPDIAWFKDPAGNILSVLEDKE